ncbi:ubiquitin-like with PHD and RING finger domains 2 [Coemansia sp. RSA 1813]|nr:ubiquitin-like with PHD and RING finger domains 2 [Coemansia sp. RSA 1646]KAJ1768317.1 ubiquitin-like with PHD and RING finger domains 2 [Coemansia sp. RSA 1843]KAJ2089055.1 ubiquitin-like with PHD and RING finger domains 2 [Coemansia sp. RSA 986]KAJ2212017.1 ubiquitin-like with PHD and RING finger domains 2 [Coemansia sp. RSA 487]KAJ2566054.1 ubiquitin-like with PHD and RING finger domains 2 [Coemansia sp. RSA 1813]
MIGDDTDLSRNKDGKRKRTGDVADNQGADAARNGSEKKSMYIYKLTPEILELIRLDRANVRLWKNMDELQSRSESAYLESLAGSMLVCPVCQNLVQHLCTMFCRHNICCTCLRSSLKNCGAMYPICHGSISDMQNMNLKTRVNHNLANILHVLIPPYGKNWSETPPVTKPQRERCSGKSASAAA